MEMQSASKRVYGLDTLRAIAIIIVLIYHYKVVVSREINWHTKVGATMPIEAFMEHIYYSSFTRVVVTVLSFQYQNRAASRKAYC